MREIPHSPVALYEVANLSGTLVAETILASVQCANAQTGRTYGRKRSDQRGCKIPCKEGAVHIWRMSEKATAARDVPVGESWASREHRTMAEIIAEEKTATA